MSIQKTGDIFLGDNAVTLASLGDAVMTRTLGDRENRIMLRADKDVIYGQVMRVMNVLQDYGFYKVALIAEEVV